MAGQFEHFSGSDYFELRKDIVIYKIEDLSGMHNYTLDELAICRCHNITLLPINRP
jgi:hypothetical protein